MISRPRRYARVADLPEDEAAKLAFPKPQFLPERENVDISTLTFAKDAPDRDEAYKQFVRSQLCAVWGEDQSHCAGVTEAAHLVVLGTGIKASDYLTIPLCTGHHRKAHDVGLTEFQITHGVNLWQVATLLLIRWIRRIR